MIALILLSIVGAVLAQTIVNSVTPTGNSHSTFRVLNLMDVFPTTGTVFVPGTGAVALQDASATLSFTPTGAAAPTVLGIFGPNPQFTQFQTFDSLTNSGGATQISVTVTVQGVSVCTNQVSLGTNMQRHTIVLSNNDNSVSTAGQCQLSNNNCIVPAVVPAPVSFTCTVLRESIPEFTCADTPVSVFRLNTDDTCDVLIERTSRRAVSTVDASETVTISPAVTPTVLSSLQAQTFALDTAETYTLKGAELPSGRAAIKSAFLIEGAVTTETVSTGFVSILFAAYRTDVTGQQLASTGLGFTIVQNNVIVHASFGSVTATQPTGFVRLPVGSYNVNIYDQNTSLNTLFPAVGSLTPASVPIISSSLTIGADSFKVIVVTSPISIPAAVVPAVATISRSLSIQELDVTPTNAVTDGDAEFQVFNLISNTQFKLASPTASCCNFVDTAALAFGQSLTTTASAMTLQGLPTADYTLFGSTATCGNLGDSFGIVGGSQFTNGNTAGTCSKKVTFIMGVPTITANFVSGTGCTGCTQTSSTIGSLTTLLGGSSGATIATLNIPICSCAPVTAAACPAVCDATEFQALDDKVSVIGAQVQAGFSALDVDVERVDERVEDVEDDLSDGFDDVLKDTKKIRKKL